MKITREQFIAATGFAPQHDDLQRSNCDLAGEVGHFSCGWCELCDKPRFLCGHLIGSGAARDRGNQGG